MKPNDRAQLTSALRDHVAKMAADLRAKMRAPGPSRVRAEQLHIDERVAEDFEVWTDLLSRRAAVLWVLKSVYVRVLEDRGLLEPGRLLDPEAQQLFERLAPHLGETAFLRWMYRDLASQRGGLPELFSPQPAEVALPSDELSRTLIAFWRHRDADTGAVWSFSEERFEGELMGDLYQELDPVVKDRFALCQTPDFVRAFILDRTLTPAIGTFGADEVRLLDPACGSGHFLIDGFKRIVAATAAQHPGWDYTSVALHALDRVVGIDLNDYACALARSRLLMTAAEVAGITGLTDAAQFHPRVYWADALEQVEREETKPAFQHELFGNIEEKPRATLTPSDVRTALANEVDTGKFHAVVANPPYIREKDAARKRYHREKNGSTRRYVSAYREYSLGSPFTERCFQLATKNGFVGMITGNSFMKREFGRPLIEKVLAHLDLTLVIDSSQAHIPFHGTSTVLLFGRNRQATALPIRVVMGKRGETVTSGAPGDGKVWQSIVSGWNAAGFQNDFVSVADLPRSALAKYPWSLQGGGAASLKSKIEERSQHRLKDLARDIGSTVLTRADDVYFVPGTTFAKRLEQTEVRPFVTGKRVRDWESVADVSILYPYQDKHDQQLISSQTMESWLWPYRSRLWLRREPNGNHKQIGLTWWEWSRFIRRRYRKARQIVFSNVSTHNHFALLEHKELTGSHAPTIALAPAATNLDYLWVAGLLNSSVLAFWMRQVFQPKGGESTGKKRQSEAWSRRLELDVSKLKMAPLTEKYRDRIASLAGRLNDCARKSMKLRPAEVLRSPTDPNALSASLASAERQLAEMREIMIAAQEELDWTVYAAFGLVKEDLPLLNDIEPLASEHRPFAIHLARSAANSAVTHHWFEAMGVQACTEVPTRYSATTRKRIERRLELIESLHDLSLIETPECKRKWENIAFKDDLTRAAFAWLTDCVEDALIRRAKPSFLSSIVGAVQDDACFLAVASIYEGRRDLDVTRLVARVLVAESVSNHPFHTYTQSGMAKRAAWDEIWALQDREDAGETVDHMPKPPEYSQGSRGKSTDFLSKDYWKLRGKLDVPKERFIAFTEVPGRVDVETLYGWAGWSPVQRLKAILAIDEELEDAGVPLADRAALLDSAWQLLRNAVREDAAAATRLKAELQALVGPKGLSRAVLDDWKKRFPPPNIRAGRARRTVAARKKANGQYEEKLES